MLVGRRLDIAIGAIPQHLLGLGVIDAHQVGAGNSFCRNETLYSGFGDDDATLHCLANCDLDLDGAFST